MLKLWKVGPHGKKLQGTKSSANNCDLLQLWKKKTHAIAGASNRERPRGHPNQASWGSTSTLVSARTTQHIPAYITGKINDHPTQLLLDSGASCSVISKKHINIVDSAAHLRETYHSGESITLTVGQKVLVDNPTRGKLDAHWTGPWIIIRQDATSVKVKMGTKEQVVHINRIRPLLQKDTLEEGPHNWTPPLFQNLESGEAQDDDQETENSTSARTTRSGRVVRPPERYGHEN